MKNYFFLFCIFAIVIINASTTATISANEKNDDSLAENVKDGFLPPEGKTIQFLEKDMIVKSCLLSEFRHKWNGGGLDFKTRIRIANKISEIPCGQHHRFTLSVLGSGKQEVFWYSANPEIAHINVKTGELTAEGEGKVRIWVADRFGRIWDEVLLLVRRGLTREETEAFYWDEMDQRRYEGTIYCGRRYPLGDEWKWFLPENATALVQPFVSWGLHQVRIPASIRAICYDTSMEDDWGISHSENVTVSVDGNNRNYYSLFGVLYSYAFAHPTDPEQACYMVDDLYPADCKNRALLLYPPDMKNEIYYVPYGVERIAGRAFEGAKYLQKIVLPDTVKAIGAGAFMDCYALKEIVIPESVTEFEDNDYAGAIDAESDLIEMGLKEAFVIVTPKGSAAQAYAIEHGISYRNE